MNLKQKMNLPKNFTIQEKNVQKTKVQKINLQMMFLNLRWKIGI